MRKAALKLNGQIKNYKFKYVEMIIKSNDYPIDEPVTDTKMSALSLACSAAIATHQAADNE